MDKIFSDALSRFIVYTIAYLFLMLACLLPQSGLYSRIILCAIGLLTLGLLVRFVVVAVSKPKAEKEDCPKSGIWGQIMSGRINTHIRMMAYFLLLAAIMQHKTDNLWIIYAFCIFAFVTALITLAIPQKGIKK